MKDFEGSKVQKYMNKYKDRKSHMWPIKPWKAMEDRKQLLFIQLFYLKRRRRLKQFLTTRNKSWFLDLGSRNKSFEELNSKTHKKKIIQPRVANQELNLEKSFDSVYRRPKSEQQAKSYRPMKHEQSLEANQILNLESKNQKTKLQDEILKGEWSFEGQSNSILGS